MDLSIGAFIDLDIAIKMGVVGNVKVYLEGVEVKHCIEAKVGAYVVFVTEPVRINETGCGVHYETLYGNVRVKINE